MKTNSKFFQTVSKFVGLFVVIAALCVCSTAAGLWAHAAEDDAIVTAQLTFADNGKTVTGVTGLDENKEQKFRVVIPATVTAIAEQAFIGYGSVELDHIVSTQKHRLVEIAFEAGSQLETIEALAFAGTDIVTLTLPESVTEIDMGAFAQTKLETVVLTSPELTLGATAFGNNANLNRVELPDGDVTFGADVFSHAADKMIHVIAKTDAQRETLVRKYPELAQDMTYVVTIQYHNLDSETVIDTEKRLQGRDYNVVLIDGAWTVDSGITAVGTPRIGYTGQWYTTKTASGDPLTAQTLTAALADCGEVLDLYGTVNAGNSFIARTDLVYDGTSYTAAQINALLAANSKKVTTETVAITKDGNSVEAIRDAGIYNVEIGANDAVTITVAKATIDLTNPATYIFRVDGAPLLDRTVYVTDDSVSLTQPASGTYQTRNVVDSVVRTQLGAVNRTLTLNGDGFTAAADTVAAGAGEHVSTFTLTADANHTFGNATVITGGAVRGLSVTKEGDVVTVAKVWYVVPMENWFVDRFGNDYAIADWTYGTVAPAQPRLAYGTATVDYTLTYAGGSKAFGADDWGTVFNANMPVGHYGLRMEAGAGSYDDDGDPATDEVAFAAFNATVEFDVTPATLNANAVTAIREALTGTFNRIVGSSEAIDANTQADNAVKTALATAAIKAGVTGSVWTDEVAAHIEVNLASALDNAYGAYQAVDAAGVYVYNYRIVAPNYAASAIMRFTVVEYGVATLPTTEQLTATYNGKTQKADVVDGLEYTVKTNAGGVEKGAYDVVLTLRNPNCYIWEGQTLAEHTADIALTFNIGKATNDWVVRPTINNWVTGRFDTSVNAITGSALFGYENMRYVITDTTKDENVVFDSTVDNISKLNDLKAGDYFIKVTIADTDSYFGAESSMLFHVFKKPGMPWWGTFLIVVGVLLVVAAVLFILWKKGVIRLLSDKLILAIRTKATVDATIAAIRANKRAEEAKLTVARAKAQEASEARRAAAAAERAKPAEERAAALEEKAQQAAERAQRMAARAEAMRVRAESLRARAADNEKAIDEAMSEVAADEDAGKEE